MPRTYKRSTNRAAYSAESLQEAVEKIVNDGLKLRRVAVDSGIDKTTLSRYVKRARLGRPLDHVGYWGNRRVFTDAEETLLSEYLIKACQMYFGLTTAEVRNLAFQLAMKYNKEMPLTWLENASAGFEWFKGFMKRHRDISMRTPEATSIGRASSFNRTNVASFFKLLQEVKSRHNFGPHAIFNVDETGCTTVQRVGKVVAPTGTKQVGSITSAERGQLVTICCAVNAIGHALPPFFIFPRVHFKEHFLQGGPPGCQGASYPSGWMTAENFLNFLKHFLTQVRCTKESPVLIVLDNHESHLSIDVLDFAKENGMILLSFPPHCSHRMQPLDCTVYGPFKKYYNNAVKSWLIDNPGRPLTIYNIPKLVASAFPRAMTPENIISGFRVSGIFPHDPNIFPDDAFLPSLVTDRSCPCEQSNTEHVSADQTTNSKSCAANSCVSADLYEIQQPQPSTSSSSANLPHQDMPNPETEANDLTEVFSPESVRPYPKAPPRKTKTRRAGKTRILTDTPVKEELLKLKAKALPRKRLSFDADRPKPMPVRHKVPRDETTEIPTVQAVDDNNTACLYCHDTYMNSRKKYRFWIKCQGPCQKWSHCICAGKNKTDIEFMCEICSSDA